MSKTIEYFKEITKIPRPSKKEEKIRNYLVSLADAKGLDYKIDDTGNLIIYVPAIKTQEDISENDTNFITRSIYSSDSPVILQSHMDMVCVKEDGISHDFENDELKIYEENGFLMATGTTLGADNGIGMALALAAIDFTKRPPLELVFTVDEEQGMSGVLGLDFKLLNGKKVINLDNENENEICISSAGGERILVTKDIQMRRGNMIQYKVELLGFKGGHSGVEIHKNHGNAIKLFIDFLCEYGFSFEVSNISGGFADNVIPSRVEAIIGTNEIKLFEDSLRNYLELIKNKYDCPEANYKITPTLSIMPVIEDKDIILEQIKDIKVGVYSMSSKIPGLVQTSMNLGIISIGDSKSELTYLPRSSKMDEFEDLLSKLEKHYKRSGYKFLEHSRYPGWQDDPEGELTLLASDEIERVTGRKPEIIALHAGLECGALVGGIGEGASAIAIGPNMSDVHSVNEKVEIASVDKMEKILEGMLSRMQ